MKNHARVLWTGASRCGPRHELASRGRRRRRLNYIGLSYGTGLGAIYANLFPAAVGRMVLDGNLNPVTWTSGGTVPSFVREGDGPNAAAKTRAFLSLCGKQPKSGCAFSVGSPAATEAKFATLLSRLQAHPVTTAGQRFGYAAPFTIVPPGDVSSWQSAAGRLQQLWLATGARAASTPRAASTHSATSAAGPYEGFEQTLAVVCSDTADPRNVRDYLQLTGRARGTVASASWPRGHRQHRRPNHAIPGLCRDGP